MAETAGHSVVTQAARLILGEIREQLKSDPALAGAVDPGAIELRIAANVESLLSPSLVRVINATGVILHTNLGRAPLSAAAAAQIAEAATHYSNLEYDIESGERGKRDVHTSRLLAELVGAESAIVVNNNAAAVFLVLNSLAKGAGVIVSRGELIEIGDGFRIPDIMSESGALLHEVGTTNRTRIPGLRSRIQRTHTAAASRSPIEFPYHRIHRAATLDEITALWRLQVPVYEDLGSGCLADLAANGINEPVARASCDAGVSVVSFSGDKLLGGPQAGVIAGKREIVERIRRNPLFRALRVDKLTIAALEVTLKAYLRGALDEIPALRMIRLSADEIARRTAKFVDELRGSLASSHANDEITIETLPGFSVIGGGSTPDQQLATQLISISSSGVSATALEARLRKPARGPSVIGRIEDDRLLVDLRTVAADEEPELVAAVVAAVIPAGR